jgi:hypothetical protein
MDLIEYLLLTILFVSITLTLLNEIKHLKKHKNIYRILCTLSIAVYLIGILTPYNNFLAIIFAILINIFTFILIKLFNRKYQVIE